MSNRAENKKDAAAYRLRQAKRIIRIAAGFTILILGVIMIPLPGPAAIVIPLGLAILATEFVWARNLLTRFRDGMNNMRNTISSNRKKADG